MHFIDAMINDLEDDTLSQKLKDLKPHVVGRMAITPSIDVAERALEIAKKAAPQALRVLGGVHATLMYKQVPSEALWIDVIVRGEGEEIIVALMNAVAEGHWSDDRHSIHGLAFREGDKIVATQAASTVKFLDWIEPAGSLLEWEKYIYIPLNKKSGDPECGARLSVHLFVLFAMEVLAGLPDARPT